MSDAEGYIITGLDDAQESSKPAYQDTMSKPLITFVLFFFFFIIVSLVFDVVDSGKSSFCALQNTFFSIFQTYSVSEGGLRTEYTYLSECFTDFVFFFPGCVMFFIFIIVYAFKQKPWRDMVVEKILLEKNKKRPFPLASLFKKKFTWQIVIACLYDMELIFAMVPSSSSNSRAGVRILSVTLCVFIWSGALAITYFNYHTGKRHPMFLHLFWIVNFVYHTVMEVHSLYGFSKTGYLDLRFFITQVLFIAQTVLCYASVKGYKNPNLEEIRFVDEDQKKKSKKRESSIKWKHLSQTMFVGKWVLLVGVLMNLLRGVLAPLSNEPLAKLMTSTSIIDTLDKFPDFPERAVQLANSLALSYFTFAACTGIAVGIGQLFFTIGGEKASQKLKSMLISSLLKQELGFLQSPAAAPGVLQQYLTTDVDELATLLKERLADIFYPMSTVVVGVFQLYMLSWQLSSIMLALFIYGLCFTVYRSTRLTAVISEEFVMARAVSNAKSMESFNALSAVRLFLKQNVEILQYRKSLGEFLKTGRKQNFVDAICTSIENLLNTCILGSCLWYGLLLVVDGEMTQSELANWALLSIMVNGSFQTLVGVVPAVATCFGSFKAINKIITRTPEYGMDEGLLMDDLKGEIKLDNVTFTYPNALADSDDDSSDDEKEPNLKNVDITVPAGTSLALVGGSGSGKSTLLSLMQGSYRVTGKNDAGNVYIDGINMRNIQPRSLIAQIGVVTQKAVLFNDTIKYNITYGCKGEAVRADDFWRAVKLAAADDFVTPETLENEVGEGGELLSGGQRQRLAIARCLLKNPKLLLLDEVTSALDPQSEEVVMEAIRNISHDRTCIMIAHRLNTIAHADNITVIMKGEVLEQGTHNELAELENGMYSRLYKQQIEVFDELERLDDDDFDDNNNNQSNGNVTIEERANESLLDMLAQPVSSIKTVETEVVEDHVVESKEESEIALEGPKDEEEEEEEDVEAKEEVEAEVQERADKPTTSKAQDLISKFSLLDDL
ncbi:hypothetical protein PCE1_000649 [Barthelona sp. PCE]